MQKIRELWTSLWADPARAAKIQTAASIVTLLLFVGTLGGYAWRLFSGSIESVVAFLTRMISIPLGIALSVPVAGVAGTAYLMRRRYMRLLESGPPPPGRERGRMSPTRDAASVPLTAAETPHAVTAADPSTLLAIPTGVVAEKAGTVSVWVFVDGPERGIRNLKNNRYLFAQASNGGRSRARGGERIYTDVFAMSCSPVGKSREERIWRFQVTNSEGQKVTLRIPDELASPAWHHFAVRWDHSAPVLEFLVDGAVVGRSEDYLAAWPVSQGDLTFGTWPTKSSVHYIESRLWRVRVGAAWLDDVALQEELRVGKDGA